MIKYLKFKRQLRTNAKNLQSCIIINNNMFKKKTKRTYEDPKIEMNEIWFVELSPYFGRLIIIG